MFIKSLRVYVYDIPNEHNDGACLRHAEEHNAKEIGFHLRANMLLLTKKHGISRPYDAVWGDKYLFAPVVVEIQKVSKEKKPNWKHFMGFGHRFQLNASKPNDGLNYYCVGVSFSKACSRERNILVFVALAIGGEKMLMNVHRTTAKVKTIIAEVRSTPLRSYSWGTVIPGSIVPHVVGNILEAEKETQDAFFEAVQTLFSAGGMLPSKYYIQSKEEVLFVSAPHLFFILLSNA